MLANYITSKMKKTTAIVEAGNGRKDFAKIHKACYGVNKDFGIKFELFGVSYYYNINSLLLSEIYNLGYEYIILDFGNDYECAKEELLRCGIKIITGSLNEWKIESFKGLMEKSCSELSKSRWIYTALFGNDKDTKKIKKTYNITLLSTPFEPDPFLIHSSSFEFFSKILY